MFQRQFSTLHALIRDPARSMSIALRRAEVIFAYIFCGFSQNWLTSRIIFFPKCLKWVHFFLLFFNIFLFFSKNEQIMLKNAKNAFIIKTRLKRLSVHDREVRSFLRLFWSVWHIFGLSETFFAFWDFLRLFWSFLVFLRLFWSFWDFFGLFKVCIALWR